MSEDIGLAGAAMQPAAGGEAGRASRLAIGLIAFLTLVDLFAAQAILPLLTLRYGVSPAAMGVAVNASTIGMAIAALAVALLNRRLPRRTGVAASLALLAVPTALLAFAPDLAVFSALRIVQGCLMAGAFTLTLAYLGEQCSAAAVSGAFAAYVTGNVAANLVGRMLSAILAEQIGLSANFLVLAALNLSGAALAAWSLGGMAAPMTGTPEAAWTAMSRHLRDPQLRRGFAIGFCILFAFIGTFTYVNFVLVRPPLGIGMMELGLVYLVFLPSVLTTPLAGALATRLGTRVALAAALGLALAGLPLLLAAQLWAVLGGLVLVAVGTFLAQAMATGFVSRAAASDRGAASGLYLAAYFSGGLAGAAALGQLFVAQGWAACVAGIAASLVIAVLLTLGIGERA